MLEIGSRAKRLLWLWLSKGLQCGGQSPYEYVPHIESADDSDEIEMIFLPELQIEPLVVSTMDVTELQQLFNASPKSLFELEKANTTSESSEATDHSPNQSNSKKLSLFCDGLSITIPTDQSIETTSSSKDSLRSVEAVNLLTFDTVHSPLHCMKSPIKEAPFHCFYVFSPTSEAQTVEDLFESALPDPCNPVEKPALLSLCEEHNNQYSIHPLQLTGRTTPRTSPSNNQQYQPVGGHIGDVNRAGDEKLVSEIKFYGTHRVVVTKIV